MIDEKLQEITADGKVKEFIKRCGCILLLGPPTILLYFAITLTDTVLQDLIVYRTCLVSLEINATDCLMLRVNAGSPEAANLEVKVEPHASMIVMTRSLIENSLPAVVCLFLGSWSDRGGRRPLLLLIISGYALSYAILSPMGNWNVNPWYLLLGSMPMSIVGALPTMELALACYIFDTTTEEDRTLQLALLEVCVWCGNLLSKPAGSYIYTNYGYTSVFGTAAVCCGCTLIYVYFFVPETVKNASKQSMSGIFEISFLKGLFTSALIKRERFHRSIIWLAIFILIIRNVIYYGDTFSTEFFFTRARLSWDVQNYSDFAVADSLLRMTGLCGTFLGSYFSDTSLATIGLVSALGSAITRSLAWQSWHMYLAACIGMFIEVVVPSIRSLISKFAPPQDVGKILALKALLDALTMLGGIPLYTSIYSHYLPPIYPSPVHLLTASLFVVLILCVVCIEVLARKSRKSLTYAATAQEDF